MPSAVSFLTIALPIPPAEPVTKAVTSLAAFGSRPAERGSAEG